MPWILLDVSDLQQARLHQAAAFCGAFASDALHSKYRRDLSWDRGLHAAKAHEQKSQSPFASKPQHSRHLLAPAVTLRCLRDAVGVARALLWRTEVTPGKGKAEMGIARLAEAHFSRDEASTSKGPYHVLPASSSPVRVRGGVGKMGERAGS